VLNTTLLTRPASRQAWRLASPEQADAWFTSGVRAQVLWDGSVRLGAAAPGEKPRSLKLEEVDRPIAFSEPVVSPQLEPAYRFHLDRPKSVEEVLGAFEEWLLPKTALLWLAARLTNGRQAFAHRVYHLMDAGTLVAVVDRAGEVGVCAGCTPARLARAEWLPRPKAAAFIPATFRKSTVTDLVWSHVLRAPAAVLPAHCLREKLFFRRPPRVRPQLVGQEHLRILNELASAPATFKELQGRTGWRGEALERGLSALYFDGCITSNAASVAARREHPDTSREPRSRAHSERS